MINHNLLSIMSERWEGAYATLQHHNIFLIVPYPPTLLVK